MRARLGIFTPNGDVMCLHCHGPMCYDKPIHDFDSKAARIVARVAEAVFSCDKCGAPTTIDGRSDVNRLAALRHWLPEFRLTQTGGMCVALYGPGMVVYSDDEDETKFCATRLMIGSDKGKDVPGSMDRDEIIELCRGNQFESVRVKIDRVFRFTDDEWGAMREKYSASSPESLILYWLRDQDLVDLLDDAEVRRCESL